MSPKWPRYSGESIFAARHQDVSQGPLGPLRRSPIPKGPKTEKNQSRLKISISLENFNLA